MRRENGLTFIELLTTLTISSILLSIAIPSFGGLIAREKSNDAALNLISAINFARYKSISLNQVVTLCPRTPDETCGKNWSDGLMVFIDKNRNGKMDSEETLLQVTEKLTSGTLKWRSFGNKPYLRFRPTGETLHQNGSFVYCPIDGDARNQRKIIINKTGRARIEKTGLKTSC